VRVLVWVLVWLVLLGAAGWWLWGRLRVLWRRSGALGDQLTQAEALLAATEQVAAAHTEAAAVARVQAPARELAVFRDAGEVAAERDTLRRTLREQRDHRRAERVPGWARRSLSRGVESADADQRKA